MQSGWVVQSINGMNVQNEERGSGNQGRMGEDERRLRSVSGSQGLRQDHGHAGRRGSWPSLGGST